MEGPGWQELFLLAGMAPVQQGRDSTATAMMLPDSPWQYMSRNPSFGVKRTEKWPNNLFGCSSASKYFHTSCPKGCLAQEASVFWGGGKVAISLNGGQLPTTAGKQLAPCALALCDNKWCSTGFISLPRCHQQHRHRTHNTHEISSSLENYFSQLLIIKFNDADGAPLAQSILKQ